MLFFTYKNICIYIHTWRATNEFIWKNCRSITGTLSRRRGPPRDTTRAMGRIAKTHPAPASPSTAQTCPSLPPS
ncbi:hypothetical protein FKM82_027761 [Ascaphus truei]